MSELAITQQKLADCRAQCDQIEKDLRLVQAAYADAVNKISELREARDACQQENSRLAGEKQQAIAQFTRLGGRGDIVRRALTYYVDTSEHPWVRNNEHLEEARILLNLIKADIP
jgi:chromosome segregation ATPase